MLIQIRNMTDVLFVMNVDPKITVYKLKTLIKSKTRIAPEMQSLMYDGVMLNDSRTLEDEGIKSYAILYLGNRQCIKIFDGTV